VTIFCNEIVSQETLTKGDWIVSSEKEEIKKGIEAGCHTIFLSDKTDLICPSLFAPTIEDAMRFIKAFERIH
jgi:hypothetical protein